MADYACPGNRKSKNDKRAKSRYNVYQTVEVNESLN
jgi:hypothetical protein